MSRAAARAAGEAQLPDEAPDLLHAARAAEAGFAAAMAALGPFGPAPCLGLGISGGPHSLALAVLAQGWVRRHGGSLLPLIVDHGLRAESAAEAARVAARLAMRGMAPRILTLRLPGGGGVQARARAARLAALLDGCRAAGAPWLLLGHHAGDQAETVLGRALAGSGEAGLAGMAPARAAAAALVLRPLLGLSAAALEAVVAAAGLMPERDPSNADRRFLRVRLRGVAEATGEAALRAAAGRFASRRADREAAVAARLAEAVQLFPLGHAAVARGRLGQDAVALAALGEVVRLVGGGLHPPPPAALAALLARGQGTLAGAWMRAGPGGSAWVMREPGALAPPVAAEAGACWDGRFRLLGPGRPGFSLGALGAGRVPGAPASVARLPAPARRALPAIRDAEGRLAALPGLDYPSPEACLPFALAFAPRGGAPLGWSAPRPDAGNSDHPDMGRPFTPGQSIPM